VLTLSAIMVHGAQVRSVSDCSKKSIVRRLNLGPCNDTNEQTFIYDVADDKHGHGRE